LKQRICSCLGKISQILTSKSAKSKWIKIFLILFLAFFVTFLVARQTFFLTLVFGDNPLVTLSSGSIIGEHILNSWHHVAYGENYPTPLAYLFLHFFSQLAAYIGDVRFFSFLMNLSFPLSFLAFYSFSKKFCESIWPKLLGATLYIINPVVITYYNSGGFMLSLVFLPFSLSFFIDSLEKWTVRNLAKAAVFTSLTMWTFPNLSPILSIILLIVTISYLALAQSKLNFLKSTVLRLIIFAFIVLVCNAPFFFSGYVYYQSPLYGYERHNVVRDFQFTYQEATILNLLTLAGNVGSPQVPLGYINPINIKNEIGIVIPIIAFASILWIRASSEKKAIVAMFASVISISILTLLLRLIVYSELSWTIGSIPLLWTFRNPLKLQLMLTICIIPLFVFSIQKIMISAAGFFRRRNFRFATLSFVLIFLGVSHIYVYNLFAFNGCMGLDEYSGGLQARLPDETISRIIDDSLEWYTEGTYRGIILPFDHNTELHVQFMNPLLYPGRLDLNYEVTKEINNELETDSNLTNLFSLLSTKYVYVNYAWKDKGFHIVQSRNLTRVTENLRKQNLTENFHNEYSEFIVETALPRLYLSNYPVFYSNIETIELFDNSEFSSKPVLFETKYDRCETCTFGTSLPTIFSNYSWTVPFQGIYDIYAVIHSDRDEVTVHCSLDNGELENKIIPGEEVSLKYLTSSEIATGHHQLLLATDDTSTASFVDLIDDFVGQASWNMTKNLEINNGTLLTSQEYDNFDLNLEFKPVEFGEKAWMGPCIKLSWTNSSGTISYLRLLFHKDGCLEGAIVEESPREGASQDIVFLENAEVKPDSWNQLRIMKQGETLVLYLNGAHILTLSDPIGKKGRIGIGSERSETHFKDVTVSKDIIAGIWLFPAEDPKDTPVTFIEMSPVRYCLRFNQTYNSSTLLLLGENFDPLWEATVDGKVLPDHSKANMYANCWLMNTTQGIHTIEIHYKSNTVYRYLLYCSVTIVGVLLIASYFPATILRKLRFLKRKKLVRNLSNKL